MILITGCAGFIGFHTSLFFLKKNIPILGIDNLNNYYDVDLKKNRLNILKNYSFFTFQRVDISNKKTLEKLFINFKFKCIINLAAQAGVRDSLSNPEKYLDYNITGFLNILELARKFNIKKIIYASTSSVYGASNSYPSTELTSSDNPLQFYAVTKKTNELMAHTWSYLYKIHTIGLRFFTVYGPYGRPDMALFKFVDAIINNRKLEVYNNGNMSRDFTYITDIVNGIYMSYKKIIFKKNNLIPSIVFNLGYGREVKLKTFIKLIEKFTQKKALIRYKNFQKGDVKRSYSDVSNAKKHLNYMPKVSVNEGVESFVKWYRSYYNK